MSAVAQDRSFLLDRAIAAEERAEKAERENAGLKLRLAMLLTELGHDPEPVVDAVPVLAQHEHERPITSSIAYTKKRNYKSMGFENLRLAMQQLECRHGDAYEQALDRERAGIESLAESLRRAREAAKAKGLLPY